MDENLKKFYLEEKNMVSEKFMIMIFQSIEYMIKNNMCNFFMYFILVLIESFQIFTLIASISVKASPIIQFLKVIMKYMHFVDVLDETIISFKSYSIMFLSYFFFEVVCHISFFIVGRYNHSLLKILSIFLSLKLTLTIHFLLFFEVSINLSIIGCNEKGMLKNFPSQNCYSLQHVTLIILSISNLINMFVQIFLQSYLFNDFSFYNSYLPWSSPSNSLTLYYNILKIYLVFMTALFKNSSISKFILLYLQLIFIIYNRYLCPFYFNRNTTIIKLFSEGFIMSSSVLFSVQFYMDLYTDFISIIIIVSSSAFGVSYYFIFKKISINKVLVKDMKYIDHYSLYINIMKLKDLILDSCSNSEASDILFSFFNNHITTCRKSECACIQIKDIFVKNIIIFESDQGKNIEIKREDILPDYFNRINKLSYSRIIQLEEDHNKLWGKFLKDLISKECDSNIYICIELCNINTFFLKNYTKALYDISLIPTESIPLQLKFILYITKRNMIHSCKDLLEDKNQLEVHRILEYNKYWEGYLHSMKKTINNTEKFWKELSKRYFIPKNLEKYGYKVSSKSNEIDLLANKIINLNTNDLRLCKSFGMYLLKIWRMEEESKNYVQKALSQINFIKEYPLDNRYLFDNLESSILIISGDKLSLGKITYCNQSFTTLVGYSAEEIIGKNVSFIIPWNISLYHDKFIENFYKKSQINILTHIRDLILIDKGNYLIPIRMAIRLIPYLEDGIYFVCLISKSESYSKNIVKQPNTDIGYCMTDIDGKLLYYDFNVEKNLGFTNKLIDDQIRNEDNNFKIEIAFPQLINKISYEELKMGGSTLIYDRFGVEQFIEYNQNMNKVDVFLNYVIDEKNNKKNDINEIKSSFLSPKNSKPNKLNLKNLQDINKEKYRVILLEGNHDTYGIRYKVFQFIFDNNINSNSKNNESNRLDRVSEDINSQASVSHYFRKKSYVSNMKYDIKESLINSKTPKIVSIMLLIILAFFIFLITFEFCDTFINLKIVDSLTYLTWLSKSFYLEKYYIDNIINRLEFLLLYKTNVLNDSLQYNGYLKSVYFKTSIYEDINSLDACQYSIEIKRGYSNLQSIESIVSDLIIPIQNYLNITYYETSYENLDSCIISFVNKVNNFINQINEITIDVSDFIFTNETNITYFTKKEVNQIFINNELNIFRNYILNTDSFYINSYEMILQETTNIINNQSKYLSLIFILGIIFSLMFIFIYHIAYFYYNQKRFEIFYFLTKIDFYETDKSYLEIKEFNSNFDSLVRDNEYFINYTNNLLNKKNQNIVDKYEDNVNYSDGKNLDRLKKSEKTTERSYNKIVNSIQTLQLASKNSDNISNAESTANMIPSKTSLVNKQIPETLGKKTSGLEIIKEEESDLLFSSNKDTKMKIKRFPVLQPDIIEKQNKKIDKLRYQYLFNRSLSIQVVFLISLFIIVYQISLNQYRSSYDLIQNLYILSYFQRNYTNFFDDIRHILLNNSQIKFVGNTSIYRSYYFNSKDLLVRNTDIFKEYKLIYQDLYSFYENINNMNKHNNFCNYSTTYLNKSNITDYCLDSYFKDGFEIGIIKTLDYGFYFMELIEMEKNLGDINTKIKYLKDSNKEYIDYLNMEIVNPTLRQLKQLYYDTINIIINFISNFYLVKTISFVIYIFLYFSIFYYFKLSYLTRRLLCNKAIFLMIPSKAYKKIELNINELLGRD